MFFTELRKYSQDVHVALIPCCCRAGSACIAADRYVPIHLRERTLFVWVYELDRPTIAFHAVACTLNASKWPWAVGVAPQRLDIHWAPFCKSRLFRHAIIRLVAHASSVQFDHRQCLVLYAARSAQDEEVYDHQRIDEHEGYWMRVSVHLCTLSSMAHGVWACSHVGDGAAGKRTPHECPYRRHQVYQPRFYARIVALAAETRLNTPCPPDCRES